MTAARAEISSHIEPLPSLRSHEAMATRAVTAATIGTALEWFDFTLYGTVAATILPKLFFPTMDAASALLASLATFESRPCSASTGCRRMRLPG